MILEYIPYYGAFLVYEKFSDIECDFYLTNDYNQYFFQDYISAYCPEIRKDIYVEKSLWTETILKDDSLVEIIKQKLASL